MPRTLQERVARLRSRAEARTIEGVLRLLGGAARLHPSAWLSRYGIRVRRDLPYQARGEARQAIDCYVPANAGRRRLPIVLYLHGGGFSILSRKTHWMMGLVFARAGYLTLIAGYRLAPRQPFPAAFEDACAAWCWTLDRLEELGGDPSRLVLAGESAGANLALGVTLASCARFDSLVARQVFDRGVVPRALLPACGILQVSAPERYAGRVSPWQYRRIEGVSRAYLGRGTPGASTELADPLCVLEGSRALARPFPPTLAVVGGADPIAPDTFRLGAALSARGAIVQVSEYPGEMHAFHALMHRDAARRAWAEQLAFLDVHAGARAADEAIDAHG